MNVLPHSVPVRIWPYFGDAHILYNCSPLLTWYKVLYVLLLKHSWIP